MPDLTAYRYHTGRSCGLPDKNLLRVNSNGLPVTYRQIVADYLKKNSAAIRLHIPAPYRSPGSFGSTDQNMQLFYPVSCRLRHWYIPARILFHESRGGSPDQNRATLQFEPLTSIHIGILQHPYIGPRILRITFITAIHLLIQSLVSNNSWPLLLYTLNSRSLALYALVG